MSQVTKFAARDSGPAARMSGFLAHLRDNGLRLGIEETELALTALIHITPSPEKSCRALKAICTGCRDEAERFDDLFDSYWRNGGRVTPRIESNASKTAKDHVHSSRDAKGETSSGTGDATAPEGGEGKAESNGTGKLIAARTRNLMRKDLRELVRPEDIAMAERIARRLGAALRDRRSRRRKAARQGDRLDFRKTIRRSLATGGEPLRMTMKRRPDRPVKITALCDVSGSMSVYARVFLAFLAGLIRADTNADTYLFHTRLVRITEALRDTDAMRAVGRMSLMADGFGGGSRIGRAMQRFADGYARRFVDGRTVVLILSDGYDTDGPGRLGDALAKLRKRGCRIIWLNPLKGWADYAPVAGGMAAALPHLDLFAAANRLEDLASLEGELSRL